MADSGAFEVLYREYYPRVFALCRRFLLTNESAEDAAQETFTRAYKTFRHYESTRPFWHWIAAIAHHHCLDQLRQVGRWEDIHTESHAEIERLKALEPLAIDVFPSPFKRCHRRLAGEISCALGLSVFSPSQLRGNCHPAGHKPQSCWGSAASREAAAATLPATTLRSENDVWRC